jgi:ABC-2 type transport system permease protein
VVCVGVGALSSQCAATSRGALGLGGAVVALMVLARMVADTVSGGAWLRWVTPLGWAEEMRPFAGPRPSVVALPALASTILLMVSARLAASRDVGTGALSVRHGARSARPPRPPRSPVGQALLAQRGMLIAWLAAVALFMFVLGIVSHGISAADVPRGAQDQIAKLGAGSVVTPVGYLAFLFIFVVIAVSAFACALIGAARREEADRQLETLLAQPVGRVRWLGGRLLLAAAAVVAVSLAAGLFAWAGAATAGVDVTLPRMLEAGVNAVPTAVLFLGFAALAYALVPRASGGIAYGLVTVAFFWQLVGALLDAPRWTITLSPFAHLGPVPERPFPTGAALAMTGIGLFASLLAAVAFRRRDLYAA